jgi:hypothetical protein
MAQGMAGFHFLWTDNFERGMLWLILGSIWVAQRGPMENDDD